VRLWTIHPCHLDAKGLVALWREALLAQKVLRGKTKGYRHHPQLIRFQATSNPVAAIATYLGEVAAEAKRRGYHFDVRKIGRQRTQSKISETTGQVFYEWKHLRAKLARRDPVRLKALPARAKLRLHPLFKLRPGPMRDWEKIPAR
jgi:hypothetical protein